MNKDIFRRVFFSIFFSFIVFSFFLFTCSFVSAQNIDCVEGIDGFCDLRCVEVDFDCDENPYQEGKLIFINETQLFNPFIYVQEELVDSISILSGNPELNGDYLELLEEPQEKSFSLGYFLLGFIVIVLLCSVIYFIHHRYSHSQKEFNKQIEQLVRYVHKLKEQGFSNEYIKSVFRKKAYDEKTISLVFKKAHLD
jgi:hypothetical protein